MVFTVNAWLERKNPYLEVREDVSDRKVLCLEGEVLSDFLCEGDISVSDLSSYDATSDILKDLLIKSIITTPCDASLPCSVSAKSVLHDNVIHFPILRTLIKRCMKYRKTCAAKIIYFRTKKMKSL